MSLSHGLHKSSFTQKIYISVHFWIFVNCSVGKRSGHIPYRDSKLTRILQHSLGGNARTAIICTLSPALSHVEQSRNTLFFATRAKEVTNNAQVNMVCIVGFSPFFTCFHFIFFSIKRKLSSPCSNIKVEAFVILFKYFDQVVSDKQLVKHLQKEVARLEAVLRTPDPSNEKDQKIQQVHYHLGLGINSQFFKDSTNS